jgi:hypothetical protein
MTDPAANWWVQREEASVRQTRLRQELRLNERSGCIATSFVGKSRACQAPVIVKTNQYLSSISCTLPAIYDT